MPRFDRDKVATLISELRNSVARLKDIASVPKDTFLLDPDKIGSSKYHFIVAIESCIDLGNHIIARNGYRVPEDYGDTFRILAEKGVFDKAFADELRNMAKFRNRLVHIYWQVEDEQVYQYLQTRLLDFKKFLDAIAAFLEFDAKEM